MVDNTKPQKPASRYSRRSFLKAIGAAALALPALSSANENQRPNILFCIADDQSWPHTGAYGDKVVKTPNFDRIAKQGALFSNAYCAAPSCTPSRGAILTGQWNWRLERGANLWSTLPAKFEVYPDMLEANGYHVGFMRKGWGPGNAKAGGRTTNPAGPERYKNFKEFLDACPEGKPWCFWFGSHDPHRGYKLGSGKASGMNLSDIKVPKVLPDTPEIRSDIADYYFEVQKFDSQVGQILKAVDQASQWQNTLIAVTSDNGMPFPRCKTTLYDLGTRMPLAICWQKRIPKGKIIDDFVSLTDLAPTFLEAAALTPPDCMTGKSLIKTLTSSIQSSDPARAEVFAALERHTWCRKDGLGYPARMIRTRNYLYIRNYHPERWPAGDPKKNASQGIYGDIDASPTKTFMLAHRDDPKYKKLFKLAFEKRPAEELYDCKKDPYQLNNLADDPAYKSIKAKLSARLTEHLEQTNDPRHTGQKITWDTDPYYGRGGG